MARLDYIDVLTELADLCKDIQDEVIQQLRYYRASVYKDETHKIIDAKLKQLQFVVNLFDDTEANDLFADFETYKTHASIMIEPGECMLSIRISHLFRGLSQRMRSLLQQSPQRFDEEKIFREIQKNQKQIVAACKQGSRKKYFFETI